MRYYPPAGLVTLLVILEGTSTHSYITLETIIHLQKHQKRRAAKTSGNELRHKVRNDSMSKETYRIDLDQPNPPVVISPYRVI